MNLIIYAILPITAVIVVNMIPKLYKKMNTFTEKALLWTVIIVFFSPVFFYLLDVFNIPTNIGMFNNTIPSRWVDFLITYISTIIGTLVSSLVIIITLIIQLKKQEKSNNEDKRIANYPIFDYEIVSGSIRLCKYSHNIKFKEQSYGEIFTSFKIENIGLNHARNIKIRISVDDKKDEEFSFGGHQFFIKKGDTVWINLIFNKYNDTKITKNDVKIEVKYDDLLNNNYKQTISFILKTDSKNSFMATIEDVKVNNEILVAK